MSQNSLSFKNIRGGEGRGDIKREGGGAGGGSLSNILPLKKVGAYYREKGHNGGFTVYGF